MKTHRLAICIVGVAYRYMPLLRWGSVPLRLILEVTRRPRWVRRLIIAAAVFTICNFVLLAITSPTLRSYRDRRRIATGAISSGLVIEPPHDFSDGLGGAPQPSTPPALHAGGHHTFPMAVGRSGDIKKGHTTMRSSTVGSAAEDPCGIRVEHSADDIAATKKAKVFSSKGNSRYAARTHPMVISRDFSAAGSSPSQGLTFIVIGDWGGGGRGYQPIVADVMDQFATNASFLGPTEAGPLAALTPRTYCSQRLLPSDHKGLFSEAFVAERLRAAAAAGAVGRYAHINESPMPWLDGPVSAPRLNAMGETLSPHVAAALAANKTLAVAVRSKMARMHKAAVNAKDGGDKPEAKALISGASLSLCEAVDISSRLDFVISTGDNMYEAGVANANDERFRRSFEAVYHHRSLQCPWFMALGNHDHGAHGTLRDAQGQVNYTFLSSRWFLPSTFYSQRIEEASHSEDGGEQQSSPPLSLEVFVLDSYDVSPSMSRMTAGQLRWLTAALAASTADWRVIVAHRPVYSSGSKHGNSPYFGKRLRPLMAKYNVSMLLSGDDHALQVMRDRSGGQWSDEEGFTVNASAPTPAPPADSDGVPAAFNGLYLLSGAGARAGSGSNLRPKGAKGRTVFQSSRHGFMGVRLLNKSHMHLHVVDAKGGVLFDSMFTNPNA